MALVIYSARKLVDHMLGIAAFTMPTAIYGALHSASPGWNGSLSAELSQGGYGRVNLTGLLDAADVVNGVAQLNSVINIGPATEDWPLLTHFSILDAAALGTGNMLCYTELSQAERVYDEGQFQRVPGQIKIRLF